MMKPNMGGGPGVDATAAKAQRAETHSRLLGGTCWSVIPISLSTQTETGGIASCSLVPSQQTSTSARTQSRGQENTKIDVQRPTQEDNV